MKAIRTQFTKRRILILLAINWITLIVLTVFFLGEKNGTSMAIIGTLFTGFVLQMGFLSDQFKLKKEIL